MFSEMLNIVLTIIDIMGEERGVKSDHPQQGFLSKYNSLTTNISRAAKLLNIANIGFYK